MTRLTVGDTSEPGDIFPGETRVNKGLVMTGVSLDKPKPNKTLFLTLIALATP